MKQTSMTIRQEVPADYRAVESLVRDAFWNVYRPGCMEHFVLHCLRQDPAFVPKLALVLEQGGQLVGQFAAVRADAALDDGSVLPVLNVGPLCIAPEMQRQGLGRLLLDTALQKAAERGFGAAVLEGDPAFYGPSGFVPGKAAGIRYADDPEADYFLVKELRPGGIFCLPDPPAGICGLRSAVPGKINKRCRTGIPLRGSALRFSKHQLHQQHIAQGAARHAEQRFVLPLVQGHRHQQSNGLRDAVAARKRSDAFQAVNDQHAEDGGGQHPAQIPHHLGRLLVFGRKHHERQKAGDHGGGGAHRNGQAHLKCGHAPTSSFFFSASGSVPSAFSMGLRRASSSTKMQPMDGSRKLPEPKMARHTSGAARPMKAL